MVKRASVSLGASLRSFTSRLETEARVLVSPSGLFLREAERILQVQSGIFSGWIAFTIEVLM